ncbi:MAG: radical SAM protein [Candidatus Hydrothermarchaeaceae archaeon]
MVQLKERNIVLKDFRKKIRIALVYPNLYRVGMSNLGIQIIYDILNSMNDVYCERFFLDFERSLETNSPLRDFDIIAFSYQFEPDIFNILKILHRSELQLEAGRKNLVVAGGPCTVNPYPIKKFLDIFFIGEVEANLPAFIEQYKKSRDFSDIEGVYESRADNPVRRVFLDDLDSYYPVTQIMSPAASFGETFSLEVSRGCARMCRFCMACYISSPRRERSLEFLKEVVDRGIKVNKPSKISILGASVSDYSRIDELCRFLGEKNLPISIPSLRADNLSSTIVDTMVGSGQRSLTIAPEADERLRYLMNKEMSDEQIINAAKLAYRHGVKKLKLYFMVGNPGETSRDIRGIVAFVKRVKKEGVRNIKVSVTPFVPKPHTPLQWAGFEDVAELNKKIKVLRKELAGVSRVEAESTKVSLLQAIVARGDEKLADIIERAFYYGGSMGALRRAFRECRIDMTSYTREREVDEALPWDKIDIGIKKSFLADSYKSLR